MNTTRIEDIPDISDIEGGMYGVSSVDNIPYSNISSQPDVSKFLRAQHSPSPQAGMGYRTMRDYQGTPYENYMNSQIQNGIYRNEGHMGTMNMGYNMPSDALPNVQNSQPINDYKDGFNCPDIYSHVKNCPMCSNYFKKDNTIYIIAIIVLAVICLLLMKKVLDL